MFRTKALHDTLRIQSDREKVKTMIQINDLGKFMVEELKMPQWMKKDDLNCFATTVLSVAPP